MQTLSLNEINQVSGAGFFSVVGDGAMMASAGLISAAAAVKCCTGAALPYIGTVSPEIYALAGFVAGASIAYGLTHQTSTSYSGHGYYF